MHGTDFTLYNMRAGLHRMYVSSRSTGSRATRLKILQAAFDEFFNWGFQAGSLNHIVEAAGVTKGALFHHFKSKKELAYAVLDEFLQPALFGRWIDPLEKSTDPITEIQRSLHRYVYEDLKSGAWLQGCPLNNLAQEMSPLDAVFHVRVTRLYETWRERVEKALEGGIEAGTVKPTVAPQAVATHVVASQMGIWGLGRSTRSESVLRVAAQGLCDYLDSLRP
jgi:AcrR family transcriptional regulator